MDIISRLLSVSVSYLSTFISTFIRLAIYLLFIPFQTLIIGITLLILTWVVEPYEK